MAYTGMLKVGRAIIYLKGYRPAGGYQHKTTVNVTGMILGNGFSDLIINFDKMRRKRNQFTYEPLLPLSKKEACNALKVADLFFQKAKEHFDKKNPQQKLL